jgi:hypothetical protein
MTGVAHPYDDRRERHHGHPRQRFWIKGTRAALAVVVVVAGGFAVWYRAAYHAWPGLEPTRVH